MNFRNKVFAQTALLGTLLFFFVGCASEEKKPVPTKKTALEELTSVDEPEESHSPEQSSHEIPAQQMSADQTAKAYQDLKIAVDEKNEQKVLRIAGDVLAHNQSDLKALFYLSLFYLKTDRPKVARLYARRALDLQPASSTFMNMMGVMSLREKNDKIAFLEFQKAYELNSKNRAAAANYGTLLLKTGKRKEALDLLSEAYRAQPQNELVANNYAMALRANSQIEKAVDVSEKASLSKSSQTIFVLNSASLLIDSGKEIERARQILSRLRLLTHEPGMNQQIQAELKRIQKSE